MPQVIITESSQAPAAAQALTRDIVIGIAGGTTHTPAPGATYEVPEAGVLTLIESAAQAEVFGHYDDGTLPQALTVLEANGNFRVVAVRTGTIPTEIAFGGPGDGATATATVVGGVVTVIAVNAGGMGYVAAPDVIITGSGDGAMATATVVAGVVTAVAVDAGGAGYDRTYSITDALELLEDAENVLGVRPDRITTAERAHNLDVNEDIDNTAGNDVVSKVEEVCEDLDAVGFLCGPNGTLAEFTGWLMINASSRIFGCYPRIRPPGQSTPMYSGPAWCGGHAARQRDAGFWANPHGAQVLGIGSLESPVRYNIASPTSQSSVLTNANGVSFYRRSGFHLMGNRLMALPAASGVTVQGTGRRVVDDLRHFLETASDDALAQNISADYYDHVIIIVTNRIEFLEGTGALRSGSIVPNPDLNSPAEEQAGRTHFIITIEVAKNVEEVHYMTVVR